MAIIKVYAVVDAKTKALVCVRIDESNAFNERDEYNNSSHGHTANVVSAELTYSVRNVLVEG